ncbi:MAG: prepilin-type N-terminal cleavage/methylation domain-containing protein [Zoogloeaceae bacterium]|jgi:prepilin-type N-terminal cleavage/methylation domain-containing protein|nr:prepilin-type N-terminal cleavage/methylation domain-containing protein [Zoogloeaceae bacterium]
MSRPFPFHGRTGQGFSLIELTVTLVVMGVLGLLAGFAFSGPGDTSSLQGRSEANKMREALRYFVLANKRLPCPDSDGDGHEDCAAGESGFLPYLTFGLEDAAGNRMRYAVYRGSAADDVTSLIERTGDGEGQPDYLGYGDMIAALRKIPATPAASHVRVAAVGADGASDCGNFTHPAFVLIVPNADRDEDGDPRDGVNANGWPCVASPLQSGSSVYDDVVVAEAPDTLIEWLFKHHVH